MRRPVGLTRLAAAALAGALAWAATPAVAVADEAGVMVRGGIREGAPSAAASGEAVTVEVSGTRLYSEAFRVMREVNKERAKSGLKDLVMDASLLDAAMRRAAEIALHWGHERPDGRSWASAMPRKHRTRWWAENIAAGHRDATEVMQAWMDSQDHRPHVLGARARSIGVGAVKVGSVIYWVEWFSAAKPSPAQRTPNAKESTPVTILAGDHTLSATARPGLEVAVGQEVRVVTRVSGPETFTRAVLDPASLSYEADTTGVASVSHGGVVTGISPGEATISVWVPGALGLATTVRVTVVAGG
jgi:uncharacterized protein YkwD